MERNSRKERVGIVVSDKMDKTIVVAIVNKYKHPLYKKTVSTTKGAVQAGKFLAGKPAGMYNMSHVIDAQL